MFSIEIQTAGWIWRRFGTEVFLEGGKVMGFLCNLQICWLWQISLLIKVLVKFRNNIKMSHFMVVRTIKVIKIQTCLFSGPKCKCQVSDLSAPADQAPCHRRGFETRQGRSASEDPPRQPCRWPRSAKRGHDASRSGPGMERWQKCVRIINF